MKTGANILIRFRSRILSFVMRIKIVIIIIFVPDGEPLKKVFRMNRLVNIKYTGYESGTEAAVGETSLNVKLGEITSANTIRN